jgi:hypothetical protein
MVAPESITTGEAIDGRAMQVEKVCSAAFPPGSVNESLSTFGGRNGGFTNFVAKPQQ